jgi:hypothetical protein
MFANVNTITGSIPGYPTRICLVVVFKKRKKEIAWWSDESSHN